LLLVYLYIFQLDDPNLFVYFYICMFIWLFTQFWLTVSIFILVFTQFWLTVSIFILVFIMLWLKDSDFICLLILLRRQSFWYFSTYKVEIDSYYIYYFLNLELRLRFKPIIWLFMVLWLKVSIIFFYKWCCESKSVYSLTISTFVIGSHYIYTSTYIVNLIFVYI